MHGNEKIDLSSAFFHLSFHRGFLASIHPGAAVPGEKATDYIPPDNAWGGVELTANEESHTFVWEKQCCPWEVSYDSASLRSKAADGLPCTLEELWQLKGESLLFTLRVTNTGDHALSIADLGLRFPANSEFEWGCHAASKVIGHHWIACHNSHLIFQRCDGRGPLLMLLPMGDASLEYYDKYDQQKGSLTAYIHSQSVRRAAEEAGAKIHIPASYVSLQPGKSRSYAFRMVWARDTAHAREQLVRYGLMDIQVLPGMTAPENADVMIALRGDWKIPRWQLPQGCTLKAQWENPPYAITVLRFSRLGENTLWLTAEDGRRANLEFFITQPLETLIDKRASFIATHQHRDENKWYDGLLAEWNNETGALLGPDNYDKIKGWRIYEVSCDDPGLSKPAFLSGKLAERPDAAQVAAMDRYVERFVWGGLQRTEEESYPYGIYGIPDWKQLRDSADEDIRGKLHIWRIYDYPHIGLMYYNLYRIARQWPDMPLSQTAQTYLQRAARTMIAMFTIPLELDDWSAFQTGLYNEMVIDDIIPALREEGMAHDALRLERLWQRKAYKFAEKTTDLFGSEYPFDTTGFESTAALANLALRLATPGTRMEDRDISPQKASVFLENQLQCNLACRGEMEMAYWWYGSDYRGDNLHYTLSYMAQMGGWGLMDYALYHAKDPYPCLRLGYGSEMSSWALLNAGRAEDGYGWRFPGKEHDGAASGGYEPLYLGETWLQQPHHGGAWYYSCEIDLGFCGYLRSAATVYVQDPIFGPVCLGGQAGQDSDSLTIVPQDGVNRRFHLIRDDLRLHLTLSCGRLQHIRVNEAARTVIAAIDSCGSQAPMTVTFAWAIHPMTDNEQKGSTSIQLNKDGLIKFTY